MSVYDAILAGAIEGLKKKPVLIIHFLFALPLSVICVQLTKFFLEHILRCSLRFLGLGSILIISLAFMLFSLVVYADFWYKFKNRLRGYLPRSLDDILEDYKKFIQLIMDKTLYDFLDKIELKKMILDIIRLFLSYYLIWILGLYSINLLLYQLSGYHYTIFGYLSKNIYFTISLLLASIFLSQLINPWPSSGQRYKASSSEAIVNLQYLQSLLDKFTSFKGLDATERTSSRWLGRVMFNLLKVLAAFPSTISFEGLLISDAFQMPYSKESKDKIENMIKKDNTEEYRLEPFRDNCGELVKTEIPLLSNACWYKVYRRISWNHKNAEKRVGYAMIIAITKERAHINKDILEECIKKIKKQLKRTDQTCYHVIQELKNLYLTDKGVILVFLLGNGELLGLKLALS